MNDYAYLDVKYWPETIICHPELENQCPWAKINSNGWHDILLAHPEFIHHAPQKITVSFMSIDQWLDVLLRHPELGKYLPDKKTLLNQGSGSIGTKWGELLARHPEFACFNPWRFLRSADWAKVLRQQPQFIGHYMTDRTNTTYEFSLRSEDIASIVVIHPELFDNFAQANLKDADWGTILFTRPGFCDKCDFGQLSSQGLGEILARHPEWLPRCRGLLLRSPDNILRVADNFPEIMNHYDLGRFKEIGGKDSPWIEVYPQLVPYTSWNFSYDYWDLLLTRISCWMNSEQYQEISSYTTRIKRETKPYRTKNGHMMFSGYPPWERPPLEQPGRNTLRNSLDSIMAVRYKAEIRGSIVDTDSMPPYIRQILDDKSLTYEQLMIRFGMMSEEEQKQTLLGCFAERKMKVINSLMEADPDVLINAVSSDVLLPWMLMYGGKGALLKYLKAIGRNRLKLFKDAEGNNAFHYAFFRCPWRPKLQEDKKETQVFQELQAAGADPDAPNAMGFSYRQVCEALEKYLLAR